MEILSFSDLEEIESIKLRRNGPKSPSSLKNLTLQKISDNAGLLINAPGMVKVFAKLSPPLTKEVIDTIRSDKPYDYDFYMEHEDVIFQLFFNKHTTEVVHSFQYEEKHLIPHLISHCPLLNSYKAYPETLPCYAISTLELMLNWHSLQVLVLERHYLDDEGAQLIRQNLLNLKELEVDLDYHFTMVGVKHFTNMEHLSCLHVGWDYIAERNLEAVTMAGTIKKLHTFNYKNPTNVYYHDEFLLLFRVLYPDKELKMNFIQLKKAPFIWPPKLKVKEVELHISHSQSDEFFDQVGVIRCEEVFLHFSNEVDEETIYDLCTDLGPKVKCVDIGKLRSFRKLDLSRVFTACPNLEKFKFRSDVDLLYPFSCQIGPQHFINCKDFISGPLDPEQFELARHNAAVMNRLLKLFALGSKAPKYCNLKTTGEMLAVEEAMKESPLALSNLKNIDVSLLDSQTEESRTAKRLLMEVVKRSAKLKSIEIHCDAEEVVTDLKREFRHLSKFSRSVGIYFCIRAVFFRLH